MNLFRKAEPTPSPASTAVVPYELPPQPSAAPKATDLERQIRSQIWPVMSPDLARAASLNLAELIDWVSGASRLSTPQIEALARKMGLLDKPETGVDVLRAHLTVAMKRRIDFAQHIEWPGGGKGEDDLRNFAAGENCLTLPELNRLAREFLGRHVNLDPETALLRSTAPPPVRQGVHPPRWVPPATKPDYSHKTFPRAPGAEHKPAQLQRVGWA